MQVFTTDGRLLLAMEDATGEAALKHPVDVAVDDLGRMFVVDADRNAVVVFELDGAYIGAYGDYGPFAGLLNEPMGITWHGGQTLLADTSNHRVQFFDAAGEMKQWGVHDPVSHEGNGRIHYPHDVAIVGPTGMFAVLCEPLEHRCQVFAAVSPATRKSRVRRTQTLIRRISGNGFRSTAD